MKHRAWLAATPEKQKESRRERLEREDPKSPLLELPDVGPAEFLVDYLFEVGPMSGEHAVTWQELDKWADRTGVELDEFKSSILIRLSREFVGTLSAARDPDYLAPNEEARQRAKASRAEVGKMLSSALRAAVPQKKGK